MATRSGLLDPAGNFTTRPLAPSVTYTSPAASTATPPGPTEGAYGNTLGVPDPAGNFTTLYCCQRRRT